MSPRDFLIALIYLFMICLIIYTFITLEPSEDIRMVSEYSYYIPH